MISICIALSISLLQQETSINLQKDGRIVTGTRASFLVQIAKASVPNSTSPLARKELTSSFGNTLRSSRVEAVVVPPDKINDKYVIGLLIGYETLPVDTVVTKEEFEFLREYSKNPTLAKIERVSDEIAEASRSSDGNGVKEKTNELAPVVDAANDNGFSRIYSGYVLSDLDETSFFGEVKQYVNAYRQDVEAMYAPNLARKVSIGAFPIGMPVVLEPGDDGIITFGEVNSFLVKRQSGLTREMSVLDQHFLKIWKGKSLILFAEPAARPYSPDKYGTLRKYYEAETASASKTAAIKDYNID